MPLHKGSLEDVWRSRGWGSRGYRGRMWKYASWDGMWMSVRLKGQREIERGRGLKIRVSEREMKGESVYNMREEGENKEKWV